jgi:hypothetical protein
MCLNKFRVGTCDSVTVSLIKGKTVTKNRVELSRARLLKGRIIKGTDCLRVPLFIGLLAVKGWTVQGLMVWGQIVQGWIILAPKLSS